MAAPPVPAGRRLAGFKLQADLRPRLTARHGPPSSHVAARLRTEMPCECHTSHANGTRRASDRSSDEPLKPHKRR